MKVKKIIEDIKDFLDFNKNKQADKVKKLEELHNKLKNKKDNLEKKLKHLKKDEKSKCLAEIKAIDVYLKKSKLKLKRLKHDN